MIGLAAATAFGFRRPAEDADMPAPMPVTPAETMRAALAAFAWWLPRQPPAVRKAIAMPAETLLSRGADLVEALVASIESEKLLAMPEILAANSAIVRDLPETTAMLDAIPLAARTAPSALVPFASTITVIAGAVAASWDRLQSAAITDLEIQQAYLSNKFPDDRAL